MLRIATPVLIPRDTIEKIKDIADIVDVIGEFVELKKSGSSFKGLSPFSAEKTPSFMVSPSKGIFKDFSTGKGGDSITFLMEHEGFSYVEALKFLAQKYGIEVVEKEEPEEVRKQKTLRESLLIVLNFAKDYYKKLLNEHSDGIAIGKSYFIERGFSEQTIDAFDLGFSLDKWDGLLSEAKQKQHSEELLEQAGLILKKENKTYDRFRGRVIFPIHNTTGKVIAFGARILTNDKKQPKYINSPETEVYHKSNVLYGIYQAKNEIRNVDNCYLVEGYTDVISLYQAGIHNVVASSGTALTKEQIRLIKRYTKNITVLYDGDAAGMRASVRGIDLILEEGLDVSAVTFPEGQDPDSYVKEIGSAAFNEYLSTQKKDFITFKTQLFLQGVENDPLKKAGIIGDIVESIAKIPDAIKRSIFFKECSNLLDVDETVLISTYNKIVLKKKQEDQRKREREEFIPPEAPIDELAPPLPPVADEVVDLEMKAVVEMEKELVRILLNYGNVPFEDAGILLGKFIVEDVSDVEFRNPICKTIIDEYRQLYEKEVEVKQSHFLSHQDPEIQKAAIDILADRYEISKNWKKFQIYVKQEQDHLPAVIRNTIIRLKWRNARIFCRNLWTQLKDAKTDEEAIELQTKYVSYKNMERALAKVLGNVTA